MNKVIPSTRSVGASSINKSAPKNTTSRVEVLKKSETISNKESLKVASEKASSVSTSQKPKLEDKIKNTLENGLNYFKEVRKQAQEDKAKGVKPLQGAQDLWSKLSAQADKLGQQAQNQVLKDFVKESSTVISDSIKGTQVGDFVDDIMGTTSSTATSSAATTTATSAAEAGATAATTEATTVAVGTEGAVAANAGTAATEAGSTATSTAAGIGGKIVGGVGAAYSLYQIYDTFGKTTPVQGAMNGATVGAYAGSFFGPVGTVVGGVAGAIIGAGLGLINNRKHPETIQREQMKAGLAEYGFIDKDSNIKLANGSNYSFASDSQNNLLNKDGTKRYEYQIDFSNPLAGKAVALTQPLAEVLTGGHDKLKTDLIGYLVNAATSNAKDENEVKANILAFYEQSKLSKEDLAGGLAKLAEENKISKEEISVYANDLASFFEPGAQESADSELLAA